MFLLIDKPRGVTSHDVVERVRKITGERRVGHGGTLDPNATGLLIIGVGRENTKKLGKIARGMKKVYEAEIFLGEERDSDDAEGRVTNINEDKIPSREEVCLVLREFMGDIEQIPPAYSAIKIRGRKAYDIVRRGEKVILNPRKIRVYKIMLRSYEYPVVKVRCEVSSGTYIRALARDIGRKLGTYAYLRNLRRMRIGKYRIEEAVKLGEL